MHNKTKSKKESFTDDIEECLHVLENGGIILYPTDTIWGLGCDSANAQAVARLYEIKQRDDSRAMLVLTHSFDSLASYVGEIPAAAHELVTLAENPLTVIYPGAKNVAPNLLAEDGSLGIRVTREAFTAELCRRFGRPIVSTSANISGTPSPQTFADIPQALKDKADYVVRYRRDESDPRSASSIIKFDTNGTFSILR